MSTDRGRRPWPHKGAEHRVATDLGSRSRAWTARTNRLPGIRPFRRMAAPGCTCSFPAARFTEGRALEIAASSTAAGGRGPLVLHGPVPSGLAILDETWVALVDRTMILTPISAHGLVWIDPSRVEGAIGSKSAVSPDVAPPWPGTGMARTRQPAWTENRPSKCPGPRSSTAQKVEQDGKHLAVEGQILIKPGSSPLNVLPVWVSQPAGGPQDSSFHGPEQKELIRHPLDDPSRSRLEFPARPAWPGIFRSARPSWENKDHFKARLPWNRAVPFPRRFLPRSTVLLEVPVVGSRCPDSRATRLDHDGRGASRPPGSRSPGQTRVQRHS